MNAHDEVSDVKTKMVLMRREILEIKRSIARIEFYIQARHAGRYTLGNTNNTNNSNTNNSNNTNNINSSNNSNNSNNSNTINTNNSNNTNNTNNPYNPNNSSNYNNTNQIIDLAVLTKNIPSLYDLWLEYDQGIHGFIPAKRYTPTQRGKNKYAYCRRKPFWMLMEKLIQRGHNYISAVDKIMSVYDCTRGITSILQQIRQDKGSRVLYNRITSINTTRALSEPHDSAFVERNQSLQTQRRSSSVHNLNPQPLHTLLQQFLHTPLQQPLQHPLQQPLQQPLPHDSPQPSPPPQEPLSPLKGFTEDEVIRFTRLYENDYDHSLMKDPSRYLSWIKTITTKNNLTTKQSRKPGKKNQQQVLRNINIGKQCKQSQRGKGSFQKKLTFNLNNTNNTNSIAEAFKNTSNIVLNKTISTKVIDNNNTNINTENITNKSPSPSPPCRRNSSEQSINRCSILSVYKEANRGYTSSDSLKPRKSIRKPKPKRIYSP